MKEFKAYIKPHKFSDVTLALHKVEGLTGVSVSGMRGFRARACEGFTQSAAKGWMDE